MVNVCLGNVCVHCLLEYNGLGQATLDVSTDWSTLGWSPGQVVDICLGGGADSCFQIWCKGLTWLSCDLCVLIVACELSKYTYLWSPLSTCESEV